MSQQGTVSGQKTPGDEECVCHLQPPEHPQVRAALSLWRWAGWARRSFLC